MFLSVFGGYARKSTRLFVVEILNFLYYFFVGYLRKFKGALSSLRQFLATESPLKTLKNAFYFTLKPLPVFKIFTSLS